MSITTISFDALLYWPCKQGRGVNLLLIWLTSQLHSSTAFAFVSTVWDKMFQYAPGHCVSGQLLVSLFYDIG